LPDPILNTNKGNYDARGHSEWFGFGKVNAYKAVTKALTTKGAAAPKLPKSIITEKYCGDHCCFDQSLRERNPAMNQLRL
jgi:hypothetical protein